MPDLKRAFPHFEEPIVKIQDKIDRLLDSDPGSPIVTKLQKERDKLVKKIFSSLTPWQKVQLARHPMRPYAMDYIESVFDDFVELRGDRNFADDRAIMGGPASLDGTTVMVIGTQKGRTAEESVERNFGMPHPEGYRKALRLMKIAEKFSFPVVTLIDTPGAYPGIGAEERGQAEAIAKNLRDMMEMKIPVIVTITGEGGSGGALGLGVGDKILMLENSVYFVCTPEACSAILWRDASKATVAAGTMRLTAADLLELDVIDDVVPEPPGGAHWNRQDMYDTYKKRLKHHLGALKRTSSENLFIKRYEKFRKMGVFENTKK